MNKKKFTSEMKRDLFCLYKAGLSPKLIGEIFEINIATVLKHIPKKEQEEAHDFKQPLPERRLHVLKIYAWLVADERDCALGIGTPLIAKSKPHIWCYLRLGEWECFLDGVITCKNLTARNRYADDVSEGYRNLVDALYWFSGIEFESGKEYLEHILIGMHKGKLSFPPAETVYHPDRALKDILEQQFADEENPAKFFDRSFVGYLEHVLHERISPKQKEILEASFGISDMKITELADEYGLPYKYLNDIKRKIIKRFRASDELKAMTPGDYVMQKIALLQKEQEILRILEECAYKEAALTKNIRDIQENMTLLVQYARNLPVDKAQLMKILDEGIAAIVPEAQIFPGVLNTQLEDLDLSVRPLKCLHRAKIRSIRELVSWNEDQLLHIRNMGQKSVFEIEKVLARKGLRLGMLIAQEE